MSAKPIPNNGVLELGSERLKQLAERYPASMKPAWWDDAVKTVARVEGMTPDEAAPAIRAAMQQAAGSE